MRAPRTETDAYVVCALARAVCVVERDVRQLLPPSSRHVRCQRFAGGDHDPELPRRRRQPGVEEREDRRRHELEQRHASRQRRLEQTGRRERDGFGDDADPRSDHERGEKLPDRDVKGHGAGLGHTVVGPQLEVLDHLPEMIRQAVVGQHGWLRHARRTRSVDDVRAGLSGPDLGGPVR